MQEYAKSFRIQIGALSALQVLIFIRPLDLCPAGRCGGLPSRPLRGHQPLCHPRQASDHHAKRHAAGDEDQGTWTLNCGQIWERPVRLINVP